MIRIALVLLAFTLPAQAQRAGLRAGPTYAFFTDSSLGNDGVQSSSVDPSFSLFLETMVTERIGLALDLGYLTGEREVMRAPLFPFDPGLVRVEYLMVTPTVILRLPGRAIRPRVYAGPVVPIRFREGTTQETASGGDPVGSYASRGITYGVTAGLGLMVPVGEGALPDVRLDLEGSYVDVGGDVTMAAVGLRLGIGFTPPPRRR